MELKIHRESIIIKIKYIYIQIYRMILKIFLEKMEERVKWS